MQQASLGAEVYVSHDQYSMEALVITMDSHEKSKELWYLLWYI